MGTFVAIATNSILVMSLSCKILPGRFKIWQVGKKSVPNPCQLFELARIFLILQDSCSKSMRKSCIAWFLARFLQDLEKILPRFFSRSWQDFFIGPCRKILPRIFPRSCQYLTRFLLEHKQDVTLKLVKIPHKILTGCYKILWGMFQNLAKSCNLWNPIKILIRSCQDVTKCNKVFQFPVRSCMILLRSRQDSCQDLAGNFY